VRQRALAVDIGVAGLLAAVVLIVSPGVAVAAMIGVALLVMCGLSLALRRALRPRGRRPSRRP
jgi:hypothetical protein